VGSYRTEKEYARRIDAALQFIEQNLGEEIPLARLASVACFSPFHFHRIFSAMVGEPPGEYVRRLRLEKTARLLANDLFPTVTDIALSCGFATSALFCRQFKARFGVSPTAWRKSKNGQSRRKIGKARALPSGYDAGRRRTMRKAPTVRVEDVASFHVAYVRHMKGYEESAGIEKAFQTLFSWAGPRGFLSPDMRTMGMSFDDPEVTPKDTCRYYACVAVDERAEPEGEVGIMAIRPGTYAIARFSGGSDAFKKAYAFMYGQWLPQSGYQPDDAPSLESYVGEPGGTPAKRRFVFDLLIPVKPL
jgi:AraC family transcriptional regulator